MRTSTDNVQQDRHHRAVLLSSLFEELSDFSGLRISSLQQTLTDAFATYAAACPSQAPDAVRCFGEINALIRAVCANTDVILDNYERYAKKAERLEKEAYHA